MTWLESYLDSPDGKKDAIAFGKDVSISKFSVELEKRIKNTTLGSGFSLTDNIQAEGFDNQDGFQSSDQLTPGSPTQQLSELLKNSSLGGEAGSDIDVEGD
jgi:hypothetical protein